MPVRSMRIYLDLLLLPIGGKVKIAKRTRRSRDTDIKLHRLL